jgi:ketosteroid isomerase-like protein
MKSQNIPGAPKSAHASGGGFSSLFRPVTVGALLLGCLLGLGFSHLFGSPPYDPSLRKLILQYFSSWSNKDMETYAACFDPSSTIYVMEKGEVALRQDLKDFLRGQIEAHRRASSPLSERAEDMDMVLTGQFAYVRVLWKLTSGERVSKGYDHFLLSRTPAGWKIVSLVFYGI